MEEKNLIKISLTGVLLIFAIIIICIMGGVIYRIYNEKMNETGKISYLNSEILNLRNKINEVSTFLENDSVKTIEDTKISSNEDQDINLKFENYVNNLKATREEFKYIEIGGPDECSYNKQVESFPTGVRADLDNKGNLYISLNERSEWENYDNFKFFKNNFETKYGKKYKVASNIIDIIAQYGHQGEVGSIAYINDDGTISFMDIMWSENDPIRIINSEKFNNLIHFDSMQGEYEVVAVDINGNIYKIYDEH